jgi:chemotaxis protein histidine kinase CheA
VRLLVVGLDVTTERVLLRELESRDEEGDESVRRFAEVLKLGAETFRRFMNESLIRVSEASGAAERLERDSADGSAVALLARHAHTLKANARAFRLDWIGRMAESLEDSLTDLKDADEAGTRAALATVLERLESLRNVLAETQELAGQVFGRSLDPGEARTRDRDLEVTVRVGRLESALALLRGLDVQLAGSDVPPVARDFLNKAERTLESLRRIPARSLFQRFPKMVADLAAVLGKRVTPLRVEGSETLVDVRILDRVGDAIVHMLWNAVAHGVEAPDERRAAGKPEAGQVALVLSEDDGRLVFEVCDDGGGIRGDAVRRRAVANGLTTEAEADGLTEKQVTELLFRPGFTTSAVSAGTAGRGVGLDSVRSVADFLDGEVLLESRPGIGTRCRLVVPRTDSGRETA